MCENATMRRDGLEALRRAHPWPEHRPSVAPLSWALDGGGRRLVVDVLRHYDVSLMLEIGVFFGGSVSRWLEEVSDLQVVAMDPWEGAWWAEYATIHGHKAHREQLAAQDGPLETFYATMWDQRDRIIPVRGASPETLHELAAHGVDPELVYIDANKDGAELELCRELFPHAILSGDDWDWDQDGAYPIREPVRTFARLHGLHLETDANTWVLWPETPPRSHRLVMLGRRARGPAGRTARRLARRLANRR
jgi:hypothetical protein